MEMDLGVGCFGHAGQTTNGRLGAHHLIIRTLIQLWISQDGALHGLMESSCETHAQSTVMRVMHVKLPSHSARGRYFVKAASQCVCAYLERGLAMCLLKPSSLYTPMRLRNASSPTQCVFAMRLRNASAPPNASSQCVCATQCVFTMRLRLPMRLHPMRLQNASAPAFCVCADWAFF